jgi:hypothetical protein
LVFVSPVWGVVLRKNLRFFHEGAALKLPASMGAGSVFPGFSFFRWALLFAGQGIVFLVILLYAVFASMGAGLVDPSAGSVFILPPYPGDWIAMKKEKKRTSSQGWFVLFGTHLNVIK